MLRISFSWACPSSLSSSGVAPVLTSGAVELRALRLYFKALYLGLHHQELLCSRPSDHAKQRVQQVDCKYETAVRSGS